MSRDLPWGVICNCHVHAFTIDHVPSWSSSRVVKWLMSRSTIKRVVIPTMRLASRIPCLQRWARYAAYLSITAGKTQMDVFRLLQARYPAGTWFVVLPMDLEFWRRKPVPPSATIDAQHAELARLAKAVPEVVPFFAVDPRRPGVLQDLKRAVDNMHFRGIKLYPNLGYAPSHPDLKGVWEFANARGLSVTTHCSRGGIHGYDHAEGAYVNENTAERYGAPELYVPILQEYPNMRLNLAHLGGQKEWERFLTDPWYVGGAGDNKQSWLGKILDMLKEHPNLYTDISYTVFYFQEFAPALKVFLADPLVRTRVLFGSDYYMADLEQDNERLLSINLRAVLGEDLFWQIANINPRAFLGY